MAREETPIVKCHSTQCTATLRGSRLQYQRNYAGLLQGFCSCQYVVGMSSGRFVFLGTYLECVPTQRAPVQMDNERIPLQRCKLLQDVTRHLMRFSCLIMRYNQSSDLSYESLSARLRKEPYVAGAKMTHSSTYVDAFEQTGNLLPS